MTASDHTMYPFATQNAEDYRNLLSVYLDAAFFPLLAEDDFRQEGHRLEFATPDDPSSPLQAGAAARRTAPRHLRALRLALRLLRLCRRLLDRPHHQPPGPRRRSSRASCTTR